MKEQAKVFLKAGKDGPVKRFHPWIFSGAIAHVSGNPQEGDVVECFSNDGSFLASGHFMNGSLAVKLFSFEKEPIDQKFWYRKVENAFRLRQTLNLTNDSHTNAYRLVHNEGDQLPGLIVDVYGSLAVLQAHSIGMHNIREWLANAIIQVSNGAICHVYDKSADAIRKMTGKQVQDGFLHGEMSISEVLENDNKFLVNAIAGQKTGFFIDQRENRALLTRYSAGKKVLNMFGYTGGFSVYAAKAGALIVHTVDSSAPAITTATENMLLNGFSGDAYSCKVADARRFMEEMQADDYDVVVLDPPAYAKNVASRNQALKGYRSINSLAFSKIKSGGILFTFSCSQVVDRQMFTSAVTAAAIDAGRKVRILNHLSQPSDHPINIFHQEGEYLKGLVLLVE